MNWWIIAWIFAGLVIYGAIIHNHILSLGAEMRHSTAEIAMQEKLLADPAFSGERAEIERKIAAENQYFSATATEYNSVIQKFPSSVIAKLFGFSRAF